MEPTWRSLTPGGGHGLFVGVRQKSGELIVVDSETRAIKHVRTARRIPEEERWQVDNLEWVQKVPWNTGADDAEADGEVPEFDFKQGPGTRLTEGEKEDDYQGSREPNDRPQGSPLES